MPNTNNLSYSSTGLALTEQFEGLRLTAYQDSVGVWTIGYGHTGSDVRPGLTITQEQASALLQQDVAGAVAAVNRLVTVTLTQNEGQGNLASSTLLRELNAGNTAGAAAQFLVWVYAGGVQLPGLVKRRQAEAALFQSESA